MDGHERRRDVRVGWHTHARCTRPQHAGETVDAETENISTGGALLVKDERADVGEQLVLEVVSEDPPLSFRRLAHVVRDCGHDERGRARQAVRFEGGSPRSRAELLAALIVVAGRSGQRAPLA